MAYSTSTDLTLLTGTSLSLDNQDAIIDQADREIRSRIQAAGLSPPAADEDLRAASLNLAKVGVMTYNRINGTQTNSITIDGISIADDLDKAIEALRVEAWASVDSYVARVSELTPTDDVCWVSKVNS